MYQSINQQNSYVVATSAKEQLFGYKKLHMLLRPTVYLNRLKYLSQFPYHSALILFTVSVGISSGGVNNWYTYLYTQVGVLGRVARWFIFLTKTHNFSKELGIQKFDNFITIWHTLLSFA
jgi:hypothetical protein